MDAIGDRARSQMQSRTLVRDGRIVTRAAGESPGVAVMQSTGDARRERPAAYLEPELRPDGSRDFRRLNGLLAQPLAILFHPSYEKPVWHCSVRAAPGDRLLSDAEWAQVAGGIMDRTGLAPEDDDFGARWVAVRHAPDHIHIVATLARQDATRLKIWNDFYRVREACQKAERRFGFRGTARADRTAAKRPSRAETERAARRGWQEPPRTTLRREVCTAAAGARTEQEFFSRLQDAGVLVRKRYSTIKRGRGHRIRRRPGAPHRQGRRGGLVQRWQARRRLHAPEIAPPLGSASEHDRSPTRSVSVHRPGTRLSLRSRCLASRTRGAAYPVLRGD